MSQVEQLRQVASLLSGIQQALQDSVAATAQSAIGNSEVQGRVTEVVRAVESSQRVVVEALGKVSALLETDRQALHSFAGQIQEANAANRDLCLQLHSSSEATRRLSERLESGSLSEPEVVDVLTTLAKGQDAIAQTLSKLESTTREAALTVGEGNGQLPAIAKHLELLVSAFSSMEASRDSMIVSRSSPDSGTPDFTVRSVAIPTPFGGPAGLPHAFPMGVPTRSSGQPDPSDRLAVPSPVVRSRDDFTPTDK